VEKKQKKKIAKRVVVGIFIPLAIVSSWYLIDRFSYSKELPYYSISTAKDSVLTIGIIGDSWVEKEKLDSLVHLFLTNTNIKSNVLAAGHSEARTKFIYQNLYKEKSEHHSSRFIIESRPDYCIVIAGVNDASGQLGPKYYSYHIRQIIKTLLHYKIKPLIVSLPEFGIEETPANLNKIQKLLWKFRNKTFALFNNNGEIDNIKTYRNHLTKRLIAENLKDSVVIIDFDKVCADFYKCSLLYADRGHLSIIGKTSLCHLIADELIKQINIHK
jgi:lysophospholipase L1-like esterase